MDKTIKFEKNEEQLKKWDIVVGIINWYIQW